MGEQTFFLTAAIFLVLLAFTMARLGGSIGGRSWALAWASLYASGLALVLSENLAG